MTVENDEENIFLSNFRSCVLPSVVQDVEFGSYPCMIKPEEKDSMPGNMLLKKVIFLNNKLIEVIKQLYF